MGGTLSKPTADPRPITFRPHPWHGVDPGAAFPGTCIAYIEVVPADSVKYEVDKVSGFLKVDRPQRFSNRCPTLYGFVPKTFCSELVAAVAIPGAPTVDRGDGDPLDICVLTDREVTRGDVLLEARPIGGLRMVENAEADDKIIAVLVGDPTYGDLTELSDLPRPVLDRLRHYFLTYKTIPGAPGPSITVDPPYGAADALRVLRAAREDYRSSFET